MDTTTATILAILGAGSFMLLLVMLATVLHLAERRWPRLTRWLDRHVGEEPEWRKW